MICHGIRLGKKGSASISFLGRSGIVDACMQLFYLFILGTRYEPSLQVEVRRHRHSRAAKGELVKSYNELD